MRNRKPANNNLMPIVLCLIAMLPVAHAAAPGAPPDDEKSYRDRFEAQLRALEAADEKQDEEKACRSDLECWRSKHEGNAIYACQKSIEAIANYQFRWTDSWHGNPKFDRIAWHDRESATLLLAGSAIQMQNGFGAWRRIHYRCVFDPATGRSTIESAN